MIDEQISKPKNKLYYTTTQNFDTKSYAENTEIANLKKKINENEKEIDTLKNDRDEMYEKNHGLRKRMSEMEHYEVQNRDLQDQVINLQREQKIIKIESKRHVFVLIVICISFVVCGSFTIFYSIGILDEIINLVKGMT